MSSTDKPSEFPGRRSVVSSTRNERRSSNDDLKIASIQPLDWSHTVSDFGALHPHTYMREVEVNCEECGGSGFDPGGIDPWGPEVCPKCKGGKTERIPGQKIVACSKQLQAGIA